MITQKKIIQEMTKYVRTNTQQGIMLYVFDMFQYMAFIGCILFLPALWMKVIAALLAGIKISNLVTLGHDAAHNSLTTSKKINKFIAVTAFLPGLLNYRLWSFIHHQQHHPMTNLVFPADIPADSYTPLSKEQFDNLPVFKKIKERFYRASGLFGFGPYFICERWLAMMLFPRQHMDRRIHKSAWKHFALISGYVFVYGGLLLYAPAYSGTSGLSALMLGLVIPFFVFQSLLGFTVYVQHTHERIPWFRNEDRDSALTRLNRRQEIVSVQLTFPAWLAPFMQMHNAYDHGAHHVCPAIPCYQLGSAQKRLNELLGTAAVVQPFSFKWLFSTMKKCRLYDYERHIWMDFDGNPTSVISMVNPIRDYAMTA